MQYVLNITVQGLIESLMVSVFILIILKEKPACLPADLLLHEDLCQTYLGSGGR